MLTFFGYYFCYNRSAWIDRCKPDLLITESTYATTIRDSKRLKLYAILNIISFTPCRCRERDFLKKVHECLERDGKVSWVIGTKR